MLRSAASKSSLRFPLVQLQRRQLQVPLAVASRCNYSHSARSCRSFRSSWVSPQNRRRGVYNSTARRPLVINGKAIATHVSDLEHLEQHQQQQQQPEASTSSNKRTYDSDLIVVLDMDECLIHSQFLSNPAVAQVYAHQVRRQHNRTSNTATVDSFRVTLPDGEFVHVNVRPGLEQFLQQITSKFETHVFTAAMPVYANPVLDKLDPDGTRFQGRWYREACTYDPPPLGSGAYVKNLHRLPPTMSNLGRTVLVDNNPLSFLANPHNGILVNSFYDDASDMTLPAVANLIEELDGTEDVRPILGPRFALEESLQDVGRSNLNQVKA